MDRPDTEQKRRRLADLYGGMSDGELESIGRDAAELTDVARQALHDERDRRQLNFAIVEAAAPADEIA